MKESDIRKREVFNRYLELVNQDIGAIFKNRESFVRIDCPACSSKNYNFEFEKSSFCYYLCRECRTLFANPRPTLEQLERLYTDSPSSVFWINEFFKPVAEIRREKIFKPRALEIVSMINMHKQKKFKVVDIGAGFGIFLEELLKIIPYIDVIAIEPSPHMADICKNKGLQVIQSAIGDIQQKETIDIAVCFELVEHLYSPRDFFVKVKGLLKKGGLFYFTTLNGEGFDIQVLWEKSKIIFPPHHINFFNPYSISILSKNTGFEIVNIKTPGKLDWDIVEGMYKDEGTDIGRFWKLVSKKGNNETKVSLQDWITKSGFSSHMAVLLRKK